MPSAKKRRTKKTSAPKTEVQGGHFGITKGLRAVPSFVSELEIGCLSFGVTLGGVSGKL